MSPPGTASAVIIGGGVVGCSIAYHLARRGLRDVVVLERETVGSGTTSKAAGGIRVQFSTETEIRFSLESIKVFERFQEEFGVNPGYTTIGYLYLLSEERHLRGFEKRIALQRTLGADVRVITPADAQKLVPALRVDDLIAAVWGPQDGMAGPAEVTNAFARRARELGVKILEGVEVTALEQSNGRVTGAQTAQRAIASPIVVNAAGPAAARVGRLAGGWAGLRPLTPDDHAIIGWAPGVEGFFLAVGFGGHGFQHSPATGRYVAEWLLDGKPSLDLSLFDPSRFARGRAGEHDRSADAE